MPRASSKVTTSSKRVNTRWNTGTRVKAIKPVMDAKKQKKARASKEEQLTAYDHLHAKWLATKCNANDKERGADSSENKETPAKRTKSAKGANEVNEPKTEKFTFQEEDNIMVLEVSKTTQREEFPSPSKEEDGSESDEPEEGKLMESSINNNATLCTSNVQLSSATRPLGAEDSLRLGSSDKEPRPSTSDGKSSSDASLSRTLAVMQSFMIKKGLINKSMTAEEIEQLLQDEECGDKDERIMGSGLSGLNANKSKDQNQLTKRHNKVSLNKTTGKDQISQPSSSDVTIYKHVVKQLAPELESQIDKFVSDTRKSLSVALEEGDATPVHRKISSSSDELMDTSDETEFNL